MDELPRLLDELRTRLRSADEDDRMAIVEESGRVLLGLFTSGEDRERIEQAVREWTAVVAEFVPTGTVELRGFAHGSATAAENEKGRP